MISEKELEKLSYTDAPKIVTDKVPGPKGQKIWDEAAKYETPTRVGGMYLPFVWNEALGSTVKDPDTVIVFPPALASSVAVAPELAVKLLEGSFLEESSILVDVSIDQQKLTFTPKARQAA